MRLAPGKMDGSLVGIHFSNPHDPARKVCAHSCRVVNHWQRQHLRFGWIAWLFVTDRGTPDPTQYVLHMQEALDLELLLQHVQGG